MLKRDCDICKHVEKLPEAKPAIIDGPTYMGPWAYMCEFHISTVVDMKLATDLAKIK